MVLYFRMLFNLFKAKFQPRHQMGEECRFTFRVMPWDSEFSYMNAGRFFNFMEIAQWSHNQRVGFLKVALKKKWWVVVRSNYLVYSGNVKKFQKFEVGAKILGWDEKYFYWENYFYRPSGDKFALGHSKVAVRNKDGVICPGEALKEIGVDLKTKPVADDVKQRMSTPNVLSR